jgi:surfeit locus 1 family protein
LNPALLSFTPSTRRAWIVLLATLVGVAGTARLGVWQLDRAAQKVALQSSLDSRSQLPPVAVTDLADSVPEAAKQYDRAVVLRGEWVDAATVFLDNRQMNGRPGFFVVTPLRLEGSQQSVLVQRGWMPRDASDRTRLASVPSAPGTVSVEGRIAPPPLRLYDFGGSASGVIRQNLDLSVYGQEFSLSLKPLSVLQDSAVLPDDGLLRDWPRPDVGIQKHYGYAFQWFALCALMSGLYVWFQIISPRLRAHRER